MAVFTVYTLEQSNITISGGAQLSGISQGNGSHLVGETITLNNNSWEAVELDDSNDSNFGDSDSSQRLEDAISYDGTSYSSGLRVEAEYSLTVQDPDGNTYTMLGFNINEPGVTSYATVEGLAFVGGEGEFPPIGVPLTVVANAEGPNVAFDDLATPPCFTAGCLIATPDGPVAVEDLAVGDLVLTADRGAQPIRWVGRRAFSAAQVAAQENLRPVRITAGALGEQLPTRDLLVSRQHRMLVQSKVAERMFGRTEVLVPAVKLTALPGIYIDTDVPEVTYFHLLFDQHEVIFAEDAPSESLFTGPEAWKAMGPEARDEILAIFPELGEAGQPAAFARMAPGRKQQAQLVARLRKNGKLCLDAEAR